MNDRWVPYVILRAASVFAPADQRAEWLNEWQSELWYVPQRASLRFSLGAIRDALWLRFNTSNPVKRPQSYLESPLRCLAFLTALAAFSVVFATRLTPRLSPQAHETAAGGGFANVASRYLILTAVGIVIGHCPGSRSPVATRNKLRAWIFFALKIALVLLILQCAFMAVAAINVPPLTIVLFGGYALVFRWVFTDQRRRCPVCLRLLTKPVRIGTSSQTFLDWYGAESMCSRGHGLLYVPEVGASYSREQEWLYLDGSWSGLFSDAASARQ